MKQEEDLLHDVELKIIEAFKNFKVFLKEAQRDEVVKVANSFPDNDIVKKFINEELNETLLFIDEFTAFVEKWHDKRVKLLIPIVDMFTDIMQAFMIGPGCYKHLSRETAKILMNYVMLETLNRNTEKENNKNQKTESADPNLTNLMDENGNKLSIQDLEKLFDEQKKSTIQ